MLVRAHQAVKEDGIAVYRASRQYAVPLTALRVNCRVSVDCTRFDPKHILSQLEESKLVAHVKEFSLKKFFWASNLPQYVTKPLIYCRNSY